MCTSISLTCRLSRARRCVENAFGISCSRWRCLSRTMLVKPDRAQVIVAACCSLHNFLLKTDRDSYCPPGFADQITEDGRIVEGSWRNSLGPESMFHSDHRNVTTGRQPQNAKEIRNLLKLYVNTELGAVPWEII